jgi:sulfotransferase
MTAPIIFFNSSLPRSGSTLLQNILGQNSNFYVTPTSGVLELLYGAQLNFSKSVEFKAQDFNTVSTGFKNFCKAGLEGYFRAITNKKYVIDKSRGWAINYNFLNSFYPDPKIICLVRDLRSILASMEKIERENSILNPDNKNYLELKGTTTIKRVEQNLSKPPIGLSINRIFDIINQPFRDKILFIKFEDLTSNPKNTLKNIYNFLKIENFEHNFSLVDQITFEDDEVFGIRNLHTIKKEVLPIANYYNEILGESLSNTVYNNFRWYFDFFNYEQ